MHENNDEIVQYFVVNKDLSMTPGKIASQVAHVATKITMDMEKIPEFYSWYNRYNQKKIILKGKQKDLEKLIKQKFYYIKDLGLTEVPKESLTVVGLKPMRKSVAQKYIKGLQLL